MRNRKILLGGLSLATLAIIFAFNNCSSQKQSGVDRALSSSSSSTGEDNNNGSAVDGGDSKMPAGVIIAVATASCPMGWLAADGSMPLRSVYTKLYNAIGTIYGPGDGSTTFALPDYRGYFLRGVNGGSTNDPDAALRMDRGDGTTGDNVGTKQNGAIQSHAHTMWGVYSAPDAGGGDTVSGNSRFGTGTTSAVGGAETRPKNISVLYCISTGGQ